MKSPLLGMAVLAAALSVPFSATAQGCSQCRDTTAGSPPQARKALRTAIPLLGIPAMAIFAGTLVLARKIKPGRP